MNTQPRALQHQIIHRKTQSITHVWEMSRDSWVRGETGGVNRREKHRMSQTLQEVPKPHLAASWDYYQGKSHKRPALSFYLPPQASAFGHRQRQHTRQAGAVPMSGEHHVKKAHGPLEDTVSVSFAFPPTAQRPQENKINGKGTQTYSFKLVLPDACKLVIFIKW